MTFNLTGAQHCKAVMEESTASPVWQLVFVFFYVKTAGNIYAKMNIFMSPLRRHIFVCFMAKSAFWRGFSALAPYTGLGPI